jgi:flagellar biosynthesis/type III secretory pathway protein FliH
VGRIIASKDLRRRPARLVGRPRDGAPDPTAGRLAEAISRRDREVVRLAEAMARRLVGEAIDRDPAVLTRIYQETVAQIGELSPAVLRVNPADLGGDRIGEMAALLGVEVAADEEVGRFGCVLEAFGTRIERGLDHMVRQLMAIEEGGER